MDELTDGLSEVAGRYALCVRALGRAKEGLGADAYAAQLFPAASVIKVGIMSALLEDVSQGRLSLSQTVPIEESDMVGGAGVLFEMESRNYSLAELCRLMMVVSDNTASNACLRQVGMDRLNDFFEARGYQAGVRRFFMSPVVDGRDNEMTAESAVLMLDDLYGGVGLSRELRDFAVGCLRRQQYREKIPLMLPPEIEVGHKTGELDGVRHDAAVVETEAPYIVSIFTAEGEAPWLVDRAMAACSLEVFHLHTGLLRKVSR
ncbi:MAG: serine hydrolase [Candidatus Eremiobacteraeota bacterium]|nr:serine hydrolase [Candidatus Eremiobacteraeota bacterium]